MVEEKKFANAYKEIYVILRNVEKSYYDAVPEEFINKIVREMNSDYDFKLDNNKPFEEQNLLYETKIILAYLIKNYWGSQDQKDFISKNYF